MFVGDKVICIVYVHNLLFWARDIEDVTLVATQLSDLGVDLEEESDAAGFLGVKLTHDQNTGPLEMRQDGLIDRIRSLGDS